MFGFLELEDDPEVLPPLLEAAEAWLRARGCDEMLGPADFTWNDESGVCPALTPCSTVVRTKASSEATTNESSGC